MSPASRVPPAALVRELEVAAGALDRRSFLRLGAAAAAAGLLPAGCGGAPSHLAPPADLALRALSPRTYAVLTAAAARIVGPGGAAQIRAHEVDPGRNADEFLAPTPALARPLQQALLALEFGFFPLLAKLRPFTSLDAADQDEILRELVRSRFATKRLVFKGVKSIALLAFYTDPATHELLRYPAQPGDRGVSIRDAMTYEVES